MFHSLSKILQLHHLPDGSHSPGDSPSLLSSRTIVSSLRQTFGCWHHLRSSRTFKSITWAIYMSIFCVEWSTSCSQMPTMSSSPNRHHMCLLLIHWNRWTSYYQIHIVRSPSHPSPTLKWHIANSHISHRQFTISISVEVITNSLWRISVDQARMANH